MTCYFCHSVTDVTDTHNNPLTLATDGHLYGPFSDPVPGSPHNVSYSRFLDGATPESANACGSCHDIVNLQDAHVERTFAEWRGTTLSQLPAGESCAQCHMAARDGAASATTPTKIRRVHDHGFPAVDLQAVANPPAAGAAQAMLDTALQATLCLNPATRRLQLTIDNTGASGPRLAQRRHARPARLGRADGLSGRPGGLRQRQHRRRRRRSPARCRWKTARPIRTCG